MKAFLQAWWRGIGVLGLHVAVSIAAGALCVLMELLPEPVRFLIGVPILIVAVPPVAFWIFRLLYPEATVAKHQGNSERPAA